MLWHKNQGAGGLQFGLNEAVFTATGSNSWVVPAGVTSVSVVAVGGGGGGCRSTSAGGGGSGGDLRYYNNLSVTPGETLTITVGSGGTRGTTGGDGGFSRVARGGTTLLEAAGGGGGTTAAPRAKNGTSSTIGGSIGGGDGGAGATASGSVQCGGGGGAGGYSGAGGDGVFTTTGAGDNGTGGAGGGGGGGGDTDTAGNGGGVNLFGEGENGAGGNSGTVNGFSATGGSYGDGALNVNTLSIDNPVILPVMGAGGGGDDNGTEASNGGQGAVRIIWPGDTRSFPSTNVWMSSVITTVIETQSQATTITIPASAAAGDLAVLLNMHESTGAQSTPSGWTQIINQESNSPVLSVFYRILQSGDPGSSVTVTTGTSPSVEMIVFRKSSGTISSVNVKGATIVYSASSIPTQIQKVQSEKPTFIVFGAFAEATTQICSTDMYFTGGFAGSGNVEPSAVFSENGDVNRQGYMRFRIYDTLPTTDVSVVNYRDVGNQTMGSFILQVT